MEKKIKDIQQEYKEKDDLELPDFIEEYIRDGRPGVAKIIGQAKKRLDRLEQERQRLEVLRTYEHRYEDAYPMICGIDEVGRGPLAGRCVRRQSFYQGIVRSFISMIPRNYRRQDVRRSMMRSWKKQLQ